MQSGSVGSIVVVTRKTNAEGATKEVVVSGKLDGRPVQGTFGAAAYPSFSKSVWVDLLGQRWELRLPRSDEMTLTNESGRVITFTRI